MQTFQENIINQYASQGQAWLNQLPKLLKQITHDYQLSDIKPVPNMTHHYVATAMQKDTPVVLKMGLDIQALSKETRCLSCFSGFGCVELINASDGMILMQQALLGTTLTSYFPDKEDAAIEVCIRLIERLHQASVPDDHHFFSLKELLQTLDEDLSIPKSILGKAIQLRNYLLSSTSREVLLHGDLHHDNILKHADDWVAIDPKGFIGDPIYDACAFLQNPFDLTKQADPPSLIDYRIKRLCQLLECDHQRLFDWLYVKTALCWAWCLQDNLSTDYFESYMNVLEEIKGDDHHG